MTRRSTQIRSDVDRLQRKLASARAALRTAEDALTDLEDREARRSMRDLKYHSARPTDSN